MKKKKNFDSEFAAEIVPDTKFEKYISHSDLYKTKPEKDKKIPKSKLKNKD